MAVRTKFFDDYFVAAGDSGIRQAVILAAGLDARAYRLPWADGTVVYEVDQPAVIEFKTRTLADIGAEPTAQRRTVQIDLREDWPSAMRAAGLDPDRPTAWCAEGLLIYLPQEAQDRLFDSIHALSAPGSAVATEFVPGMREFDPEKARAAAETFSRLGLEMDMPSLVYHGERISAADYLSDKGWQMAGSPGRNCSPDTVCRYRTSATAMCSARSSTSAAPCRKSGVARRILQGRWRILGAGRLGAVDRTPGRLRDSGQRDRADRRRRPSCSTPAQLSPVLR